MIKILIVCIGNICRSPMAEVMFSHAFQKKKRVFQIASAGIGALVGHPADPSTLLLMQEKGLDVSQHRARQLTATVLKGYDLVLVMEQRHVAEVVHIVPFARGRVHCLGKWTKYEIPDPYQKPLKHFKNACALIEGAVESWLDKI